MALYPLVALEKWWWLELAIDGVMSLCVCVCAIKTSIIKGL